MKFQDIVSDVRSRVENAGRQYQGAFKAYFSAQRKALTVVSRNGQTLANTEIGAAKNVFAAAKASFDKARRDGLRKIANNPQAYVPNGRAQIVSAYKDAIDLLKKTGNELGDVVTDGYKTVVGKLSPNADRREATTSKAKTKSRASTRGKATARKTAAKRGTASRKASNASANDASSADTANSAAKAKTAATTKRRGKAASAGTTADTDTAASDSDRDTDSETAS